MQRLSLRFTCAAALALAACSSNDSNSTTPPTDDQFRAQVIAGMQSSLKADLDDLVQASKDLQAAAPTGHGWDATGDKTAIDAMIAAWKRARTAYEHTEGALAPIFPDVDVSIDERYDGFLDAEVQANEPTDSYLFDDQGVTGLHAVERILYANSTTIPQSVIDFEKGLTGYVPAAFPATTQEADDFKNKLIAKMIADAQTFQSGWANQKNISLGDAFNGLIGLMNEQKEKVNNAGLGHEESRYSQRTMKDLRDNLDGTKKIYEVFQPWVKTKAAPAAGGEDGNATDASIEAGFAGLATEYAKIQGDAFPTPPATWNGDNPSAADLATPFGSLYSSVRDQTDQMKSGSVVNEMIKAGVLMGLPQFME